MRMSRRFGMLATILFCGALIGCGESAAEPPADDGPRPRFLVTADMKDSLLERLERQPYADIWAFIEERAARDYEEPDPDTWDHSTIGHNNETAQANALLAWLRNDQQAAGKARDLLLQMPADFDRNTTWDVNIRMPHVLMPYCYAWDLLRATPWFSQADADEAAERVTTVTSLFFDRYLNNPITRQLVLGVSQNNHPIRTASAIGMVALTFPKHAEAEQWANWAISELSYLMGPDGQYIQSDGGVSEGPFYYGFAFAAALPIFIAMHNGVDAQRVYQRDCRNRQDSDPWTGHGCVEGEAFTFDNPLRSDHLRASADWSVNLRLPGNGWRAPLGDANFIAFNGGALLTAFGGAGHLRWDWENNAESSPPMTWGMDLSAQHLAYLDEATVASEPPWRNRFMPAAGNAVFRSSWQDDARWLLLVAESGSARKTLHDHVDGTSFTLAAYGEYLLLDPGYYKPDDKDNAKTAHSDSHNTLRINGQGAPNKGLLLDFGDADAFLRNTIDGEQLAYAEAHQSYQSTDIERSVAFVRKRYFVVADRLSTSASTARDHGWRLGGWAGYDVAGQFEVFDCLSAPRCGARWQRELAGVDLHLAATAPGLTVTEPEYTPLAAPHVEAFDRQRNVQDHGVIDGHVQALAPGYLAVLAPYRVSASSGAEDAAMTVSSIDAGSNATAWLIKSKEGEELAWLRDQGASGSLQLPGSGATVSSDAELVIVATDGNFGLMARGTKLSIDGKLVLEAKSSDAIAKTE